MTIVETLAEILLFLACSVSGAFGLLALFRWRRKWRVVRDTGIHLYMEHPDGRRKIVRRQSSGHQPIDRGWLETGEWTNYGNKRLNSKLPGPALERSTEA